MTPGAECTMRAGCSIRVDDSVSPNSNGDHMPGARSSRLGPYTMIVRL